MIIPPDLGRPWLWLALLAQLAAAVGAVLLARRRKEYAPAAWFIGITLAANLLRGAVLLLVLAPARASGAVPYTGLARIVFHLGEQAPFVGYLAGVAALAIWTFTRRTPWIVDLVWVAIVAGLAASYPELRRERLQSVYLVVTLMAIAVSVGAIGLWWHRRERTKAPEPPEITAGLIVLCECVSLVGPYAAGLIDVTWAIAWGFYFGLYATIAILQGLWLRTR